LCYPKPLAATKITRPVFLPCLVFALSHLSVWARGGGMLM